MLFPGAVSSLLSQALAAASAQLPLRLVIAPGANPDSLADLPWELLHRPSDATSAGVFIATIGTVVISRAIRADDTFPAPEIADGPLRVVLAASHAAERADSAAASMQRLADVGAVELTLLHDRPLRDLLDALDLARPAVLHVIAPARRGPDGTEIALEWTADTVDWISAHRIGDLLAGLAKPPALVVLELLGGEADAALPSEAAATLATFAVAATLELPSNVTARAASTFFERLYERLGSGRAIDASVADARRALLRDSSSASFALPTLYMNHPGPIAVPAGRPEPAPAPAPAPAPEPAPEPPPAAPPDDAVDPAVRRRLRRGLETADPWRTVERLAIEAAVPEEVALRVLRDSDDVRFSQGRSGRLIAGLVSRVGPAAARQR